MNVNASAAERERPRAGDDLLDGPVVSINRAFTAPATPDVLWPWILQLGKGRAGWYLPHTIERFIPPSRRAIRDVDPRWQDLTVGDVIPDYGGKRGYFEVAEITAPHTLVYRSSRGRTSLTWAITLDAVPDTSTTRVSLRLRLAPVPRAVVAKLGDLIDTLTVAGMAAGLAERLSERQD